MADLPLRGVDLDGLQISNPPSGDYMLSDLNIGGKPDTSAGDKSRPREDGVFFGRDLLSSGRNITIEGSVSTNDGPSAVDAWNLLTKTWDAENTRLTPGAVVPLRLRLAGGATRVVYGRPRELDPKDDPGFSLVEVGRIDFAAQFRCVNHLFYDDVEQVENIGIVSSYTTGLTGPLHSPLTSQGVTQSQNEGTVEVGGTEPASPTITIYGPIINPAWFDIGHGWLQLNMTLLYDQYVTIDCTPWNRSVRLNGVTNVAGALTQSSLRLSQARLTPGVHQVVLRGTSTTGTARMQMSFRNTYTGF